MPLSVPLLAFLDHFRSQISAQPSLALLSLQLGDLD